MIGMYMYLYLYVLHVQKYVNNTEKETLLQLLIA